MSSDEIAVVLICLVGGYWAVSAWLSKKSNARDDSPRTDYSSPDRPGADGRRAEPPASAVTGVAATWATTLGVAPSASREQIVAAYKRLISEYHPDKVARMGSEIRELAERKSKEINAAYDFAIKFRL